MKIVARSGIKVVLLAWVFLVLYSVIFSFSYVLFIVVIFLHLVFKRSEREIIEVDENFILSPLDGKIKSIKIDEENKTISLILKKSLLNIILESSEIRAIIKTDDAKESKINGLEYRTDYFCNATRVEFKSGISVLFKPSKYSLFKLEFNKNYRKGERIGIFSSGLVEISLPYDSRILVGVNDKILANQAIALIGEN